MAMTKRDFEAIATAIVATYPLADYESPETVGSTSLKQLGAYWQWERNRQLMIEMFRAIAPTFDADRFEARTDCVKRDRLVRDTNAARYAV